MNSLRMIRPQSKESNRRKPMLCALQAATSKLRRFASCPSLEVACVAARDLPRKTDLASGWEHSREVHDWPLSPLPVPNRSKEDKIMLAPVVSHKRSSYCSTGFPVVSRNTLFDDMITNYRRMECLCSTYRASSTASSVQTAIDRIKTIDCPALLSLSLPGREQALATSDLFPLWLPAGSTSRSAGSPS